MDGLLPLDELKRRFKRTESFSRSELADAFSGELGRVVPSQVTRDIQALYDHKLDRKPIPYDVAVELYVIRLYRADRTMIGDAKRVPAEELLNFIEAFDQTDGPMAAKWAYASKFGGGQSHFNNYVVGKIKAMRIKALNGATVNVSAVPA